MGLFVDWERRLAVETLAATRVFVTNNRLFSMFCTVCVTNILSCQIITVLCY